MNFIVLLATRSALEQGGLGATAQQGQLSGDHPSHPPVPTSLGNQPHDQETW